MEALPSSKSDLQATPDTNILEAKRRERVQRIMCEDFVGQAWKYQSTLLLIFYWLECSHMPLSRHKIL